MKTNTKTKVKRTLKNPPLSPLSQMVNMYYLGPEHAGIVSAEVLPGVLQLSILDGDGKDTGDKAFLSVDNIEGHIFVKDKAKFIASINNCDEEAEETQRGPWRRDKEDEDDCCACPDCTEEREQRISKLEEFQVAEALQGIVKETAVITQVSPEVAAECTSILAQAKKDGYKSC